MSSPKKRSRYQKIRRLSSDPNGSRTAYLGKDNTNGNLVAIKTYSFAGENWAGSRAYQERLKTLYHLDCPGVARALNFFPTGNGFGIVREYIEGRSLAEVLDFDAQQFQTIATNSLNIIAALPCIHFNLKPENIILGSDSKIYFVDFGFPYIEKSGNPRYAEAGTPGFMSDAQLQNREPTTAMDLYGLGMSLACYLTQTATTEVDRLTNAEGTLDIADRLPLSASPNWIEWLQNLVCSDRDRRYDSAIAALDALKQLDLARSPQVSLHPDRLDLKSTTYGERLQAIVTVINEIPDTTLQGNWQLEPHANDKTRSLQWVTFRPSQFNSNRTQCQVTIDTSKLYENSRYERQILLHSNAEPPTQAISLRVKTASIKVPPLPTTPLAALGGGSFAIGYVFNIIWSGGSDILIIFFTLLLASLELGAIGYVIQTYFDSPLPRNLSDLLATLKSDGGAIVTAIGILGFAIGINFQEGFDNPFLLVMLLCAAGLVGILVTNYRQKAAKMVSDYRKAKPRLVKPD